MSTFKVFKNYRDELKSLSKVVNKFDFDELVNLLLANDCKGNFKLFEPTEVLSKQKRFAFLKFAIQHVYVGGHKQYPESYSDLRLANMIKTLFTLPELETQIKVYDKASQTWKQGQQIGLTNLLKLWNKATVVKKTQVVTK